MAGINHGHREEERLPQNLKTNRAGYRSVYFVNNLQCRHLEDRQESLRQSGSIVRHCLHKQKIKQYPVRTLYFFPLLYVLTVTSYLLFGF